MSIRTASASGINNGQRDMPFVPQPYPAPSTGSWTRPADWPILPSMTSSDSKFIGLLAVTNDTSNYIAFTFNTTAGTYNVDWGDGTSSLGVTTGTVAQHQYDYSTLGTSVTSRGYKTATVIVTPNTGGAGLTNVNLQTKYVLVAGTGTLNAYVSKWLDIGWGSPNLGSHAIGGTITPLAMLEQASFYGCISSFQNCANALFLNCSSLQSIPVLNLSPNYDRLIETFSGCRLLKNVPTLPSTTSITGLSCNSMFQNCLSLETVPDSVFQNLANKIGDTSSMFSGCSTLKSPPMLSWSTLGTYNNNSMFSNCSSLITVPKYNFFRSSTMSSMFFNCVSLINVPPIIAPLSSGASALFNGCQSLTTCPVISFPLVQNWGQMFANCRKLITVPNINAPAATSFNSTFQNCTALQSVGTITTTTALTDTSIMFSGCASLINPPTITVTSAVTNMASMFSGCSALSDVPTYNSSNVTNMSSMFLNSTSLPIVPTFTTTKVQNMSSMFQGCLSLTAIPAFDTSNVNNMVSMASSCSRLSSVSFTDVTKVTNVNSIFNGCSSLPTEAITEGAPNSWNTSNVTDMRTMFQNCSLISTIPTFDATKVTNTQSMFFGCTNLNSVPALNFSNVTGGMTNMFGSTPTLSNIAMTGVKVSLNISSAQMSKTALEDVFLNRIVANTTSQTITVTSNPGTDTSIARTGGAPSSISSTVTFANTVGITTGMIAYGTGYTPGSKTLTVDVATGNITTIGAGLAPPNGNKVGFLSIGSITNITANSVYYVVSSNASGNFKVSATPGGSPITFTGTTSSCAIKIPLYVQSVVANTNVTFSTSPYTTTGGTVNFRTLDMGAAFIKNWTVSG